jgi:hypothetical protein
VLKQSVQITGTGKVLERIAKLRRLAPEALAAATYIATSTVISTAMRLTPVDTGWLRSSRFVRLPVISGDRFTIEAGFGATYAIFVHEIDRNYVVGEWKFLQTAVAYHRASMLEEIARMAAGMMASGRGIDSLPKMHPTEPMDATNRGALEGLASRYRRRRSARTAQKRERSKVDNAERRRRESATALAAQREGRRPPRPGRG